MARLFARDILGKAENGDPVNHDDQRVDGG